PTSTYTLSLHDALPISKYCSRGCYSKAQVGHAPSNKRSTDTKKCENCGKSFPVGGRLGKGLPGKPRAARFCGHICAAAKTRRPRSEEHTSELQSPYDLV